MATFSIEDGDVVLGDDGQITLVSGATARDQDVAYFMLTPLRDNRVGTRLLNADGGLSSFGSTANGVAMTVQESIQALKEAQDAARVSDPDERIASVTRLAVVPVPEQHAFAYLLNLQSVSGDTSTRTGILKLGQMALPDSVVQSLGRGKS